MALGPRFRRVAALDRRFVDREHILTAFDAELGTVGAAPRVLNLVGVGGIGKSRLLRELRSRCEQRELRTATLDLQVSAMRQQEDALAILRTEFGGQGVRFDRFDIAYAVLWQRLHPNLPLSQADLPFRGESEVLTSILDDTSGVPVFGTAVGLAKLANRAKARKKSRRLIEGDETLARLDELPTTDVLDAVTYLFAEDLREDSVDEPYAVFVDAFEALASAGGSVDADGWLRDLVVQLDRGLVVVASRELLPWPALDPEWGRLIRAHPVHGLPMQARRELLSDGPVEAGPELDAIASASQGLPFYLHLAMDTREHAPADSRGVVSSDEILRRFIQHVEPSEVRLLELLSVARVFDYEIFGALAGAFDLPGDRMRWESVAAYSFVYPAGDKGKRLHQLMVETLRERLSPTVVRDVHVLLRDLWDRRSTRGHGTALALREAAYHGVRAGRMSAEAVLDHADRAVHHGGKQAVDGMVADLHEYLAEQHEPGLAEVARCLDAEAAVLVGNATRAIELTPAQQDAPRGAASTRLAIAGAHARRIAGATAEANRGYELVWQHDRGHGRRVAGLWMADLHMCQGRMASAVALVEDVLAGCPPDELVLRGDLIRLLHLVHRFQLNLEQAATTLAEARTAYQQAGAVVGLANIETNRVELLAWTDPLTVPAVAAGAITSQQELGALHELGKTYTALGVAQLRVGRLGEAATSFDTACDYLERARYRSGRARAELFRGALHARNDDRESAIRATCWAVDELVAAQVYPTLILLAEQVLARLGHVESRVRTAAAAARESLQPLDSVDALDHRIDSLAGALLGEGA